MTPFEKHCRTEKVVREPDEGRIRHLRMPHARDDSVRVADGRGVYVDGAYYQPVDLEAYRNEVNRTHGGEGLIRVLVEPNSTRKSLLPGQRRFVDVWAVGDSDELTFITRAFHPEDMTTAEKQAFLKDRMARHREIERDVLRPARHARAEWTRQNLEAVEDGDPAPNIATIIADVLKGGRKAEGILAAASRNDGGDGDAASKGEVRDRAEIIGALVDQVVTELISRGFDPDAVAAAVAPVEIAPAAAAPAEIAPADAAPTDEHSGEGETPAAAEPAAEPPAARRRRKPPARRLAHPERTGAEEALLRSLHQQRKD